MPSTRMRSVKNLVDSLRGQNYLTIADFTVHRAIATADFSGANSGFYVFIPQTDCVFLGAEEIHAVVGASGTIRVKKIPAASAQAPGAAADANNIDMTATFDLTASVNTRRELAPIITAGANRLAAGDKVALASAAGAGAGLAGGLVVLRFAYV